VLVQISKDYYILLEYLLNAIVENTKLKGVNSSSFWYWCRGLILVASGIDVKGVNSNSFWYW
jgi:hypothetical protein